MAPTWLRDLDAQWQDPARRAWTIVEKASDEALLDAFRCCAREAQGLAVTAKALRRGLTRGEADFPTRYFALMLALAWELEPAAGEAIVRSALKRSGDDHKHARVMLVGARRFFGVKDFLALVDAPCLAGEGARDAGAALELGVLVAASRVTTRALLAVQKRLGTKPHERVALQLVWTALLLRGQDVKAAIAAYEKKLAAEWVPLQRQDVAALGRFAKEQWRLAGLSPDAVWVLCARLMKGSWSVADFPANAAACGLEKVKPRDGYFAFVGPQLTGQAPFQQGFVEEIRLFFRAPELKRIAAGYSARLQGELGKPRVLHGNDIFEHGDFRVRVLASHAEVWVVVSKLSVIRSLGADYFPR
jgi:hypothetical protein